MTLQLPAIKTLYRIFALVVLVSVSMVVPPAALSDTFFVNGRRVSAEKYQAFKFVQSAADLMKNNKIDEATDQLRRALKVEPTLAEAHSMLGLALARAGHIDESEEQFQMAIVGDESLIEPRLNLASLYQATGRVQDSVQMYQSFIVDFPHSKQTPEVKDRIALLTAELDNERGTGSGSNSNYLKSVTKSGVQRWPDWNMPLHVYIVSGDAMDNYVAEYERILEQSFREWERAAHGKVHFRFCGSREDADIVCEWVPDSSRLTTAAEAGETQLRCLGNAICKAHMQISLTDPASPFPQTENQIRSVCLHEIGHSLGMVGHSGRASDVLFCTSPLVDREQHLSTRDIATLNGLYDKPLDNTSLCLAYLEKETKGNAINMIRLALIVLCAIAASLGGIALLTGNKSKKKKKPAVATRSVPRT
jgi:predicted Zn-dependent protease